MCSIVLVAGRAMALFVVGPEYKEDTVQSSLIPTSTSQPTRSASALRWERLSEVFIVAAPVGLGASYVFAVCIIAHCYNQTAKERRFTKAESQSRICRCPDCLTATYSFASIL